MKQQCKGCKKAIGLGGCKVFMKKPKKCWAWTDDPSWEIKIKAQVKKYQKYKKGEKEPYWEVEE